MNRILELRILENLRRIVRSIDVYSKKLKAEFDMTSVQILCLHTIEETGPITLASLAKLIHVSSSTLVGVIDRLEKKGLLKRERSLKDRRYTFITLTDDGKEKVKKLPTALNRKFTESLSKLSNEEQNQIVTALDSIVNLIEADQIDASPILESGNIS